MEAEIQLVVQVKWPQKCWQCFASARRRSAHAITNTFLARRISAGETEGIAS